MEPTKQFRQVMERLIEAMDHTRAFARDHVDNPRAIHREDLPTDYLYNQAMMILCEDCLGRPKTCIMPADLAKLYRTTCDTDEMITRESVYRITGLRL